MFTKPIARQVCRHHLLNSRCDPSTRVSALWQSCYGRGSNPALEARFDALLREGQKVLSSIAGIVGEERVG